MTIITNAKKNNIIKFHRLSRENRAGSLTCNSCKEFLYMTQKHIQSIKSSDLILCKQCSKPKIKKTPKPKNIKIMHKTNIKHLPTTEQQKVFQLIKQGFKYEQIADILKVSVKSLYVIVADSKKQKDAKYYLNLKIKCFVRGTDIIFTVNELLDKITINPKCYLTNKPIDLLKPETYSLDHIIPRSKNGDSSLSNCQIITQEANMVKNSLLLNELYEICETILANRNI